MNTLVWNKKSYLFWCEIGVYSEAPSSCTCMGNIAEYISNEGTIMGAQWGFQKALWGEKLESGDYPTVSSFSFLVVECWECFWHMLPFAPSEYLLEQDLSSSLLALERGQVIHRYRTSLRMPVRRGSKQEAGTLGCLTLRQKQPKPQGHAKDA